MRHDWMDWLGGYPFEVATPEAIFDFYHARGYYPRKVEDLRRAARLQRVRVHQGGAGLVSRWTGDMKRAILDFVSRVGYDIQKQPGSFPPYRLLKRVSLGHDPWSDVRTILGDDVRCVFDVGAHIGQTASRIVAAFPRAHVYSFEPDPHSFAQLEALAERSDRIDAINAAVGDTDGHATSSSTSSIRRTRCSRAAPGADQFLLDSAGLVVQSELSVPVLTLDRFCAAAESPASMS